MFGIHLVKRGFLSDGQLIEALEEQRLRSVPIGRLAIEQELLTPREVVQVLSEQALRSERFAKLALELDLITEPEFWKLLQLHQARRPQLEDVFIERAWIARDDLETERKAFELAAS